MKLSGGSEVQGSPEQVFDRLMDPALLARCIPGCDHMEEVEPGVYATSIGAGVGAVKRHFEGRVTVSEVDRPNGYRLTISGDSPVGHVDGGARVRLEPTSGTTRVTYEGEARLSGLLAAFGGRMLEGAANKAVASFFERLVQEAGR